MNGPFHAPNLAGIQWPGAKQTGCQGRTVIWNVDVIAWLGNGDNFVAGFKEAFNFLYEEALGGRPGYIDVITHAELGGRPNLASAVERMIRYVKQFGDQVWIANRREITNYLLSQNEEAEEYRPYQ